jgi:hypothetical protein
LLYRSRKAVSPSLPFADGNLALVSTLNGKRAKEKHIIGDNYRSRWRNKRKTENRYRRYSRKTIKKMRI